MHVFSSLQGSVEIMDADGKSLVSLVGPACFGEDNVLPSRSTPQSHSVRAVTFCEVLALPRAKLLQLLDGFPDQRAVFWEEAQRACDERQASIHSIVSNLMNKGAKKMKKLLQDEAAPQQANKHLIFMPDSSFRQIWQLVVFAAFVFYLWVIPAQLAFCHSHFEPFQTEWSSLIPLLVISYSLDLFFVADFYLRARRFGTADDDGVDREPDDVWCRFLSQSRWLLLIQVIPLVPIDALILVWVDPRLASFMRLTRLLHGWQLLSWLAHLDHMLDQQRRVQLSSQDRRMGKLVLLILLNLHWMACLWYLLGVSDAPSRTWFATKPAMASARGADRYVWSLYWAAITAATVGYGTAAHSNCNSCLMRVILL